MQQDRKKQPTNSTAPLVNKANGFTIDENKTNCREELAFCQSGEVIYPLAQDHHPADHFG